MNEANATKTGKPIAHFIHYDNSKCFTERNLNNPKIKARKIKTVIK